jgi:hypothetical protein
MTFFWGKNNLLVYALSSLIAGSSAVGISDTAYSQNFNTGDSSFVGYQASSGKEHKKTVKGLEGILKGELKQINRDFRQQENNDIGWYAKAKDNNSASIVILLADNHELSQESKAYIPIFEVLKKYSDSFGIECSEFGAPKPFKSTVDILNLMVEDSALDHKRFNESDYIDSSELSKKIVSSEVSIYGFEDKNLILISGVCDKISYLATRMGNDAVKGSFLNAEVLKYDAEIKRLYSFLDKLNITPEIPNYYTNRILDGTLPAYVNELDRYLVRTLLDARTLCAVSNMHTFIKSAEAEKGPTVTTMIFGGLHMDLVMDQFDKIGLSYILISNQACDD